jgi:hypothetical protein
MTRLRLRRPKGECGRRQYLRIARRRTPHGGVQRRAPQNRRRNSQDRTLGSLSELNRWQRIIGDEPKRSQPGRKPSEHVGHRGPRTSCRGIVGCVLVSASVSDPTPCAAVHYRHRHRVTAPRHHVSERPQRRRGVDCDEQLCLRSQTPVAQHVCAIFNLLAGSPAYVDLIKRSAAHLKCWSSEGWMMCSRARSFIFFRRSAPFLAVDFRKPTGPASKPPIFQAVVRASRPRRRRMLLGCIED